jgi:hypothetical protein
VKVPTVAALSFAVLAGCGNVLGIEDPTPAEQPDAAATADAADLPDGSTLDAPADPADAAPVEPGDWGDPTPLLNVNTTASNEMQPTVSADGLELIFRRTAGGTDTGRLFVSTRSSPNADWSVPMEVPNTEAPAGSFSALQEPELSPDGVELYVSNVQWTLRATRATRGQPWGEFVQLFEGKGVSLSADGLTAHYLNLESGVTGGFVVRRRASLAAAWGPEESAAMPVPVSADFPTAYNAFDVAREGTYAVFTHCANAFKLPEVAELRRETPDAEWEGFREVPALARVKARSCDLVSDREMVCEIVIGSRSDLYRVTREDRP